MKRIIVFLLAVVMAFSVFACAKNEGNKPATTSPNATTPDETTPGTTTPGATTEITTEMQVTVKNPDKPDLEVMTFGGTKYRVSTMEAYTNMEVFADETSANIRDQAIWERNSYVEETYDVKIVPVIAAYDGDVLSHVNSVLDYIYSGDDLYDTIMATAHSSGMLIVLGVIQNWNNFKYNDFSKYYWMSDINEKFEIADTLYTAVGDMCITILARTYGLYYNRTKGDALFVDDGKTTITEEVLEKIENMEWTLDYFTELVSGVYSDIDYEVGPSAGDFYGYTSDALCSLDNWQFAFDIPMLAKSEKKTLECVFDTEKTSEMVDKLASLYRENQGSYITDTAAVGTFSAGKALFYNGTMLECILTFKNMEDNYLILPEPLWDESQEKYMTGAQDTYSVISVPITCKNTDMVSYITEVLNYESRNRVFPVYYEETLQKQYARDPITIEMLDIIMEGRNFDLGTMFNREMDCLPLTIRHCVGHYKESFKTVWDGRSFGVTEGVKFVVGKYKLNNKNPK